MAYLCDEHGNNGFPKTIPVACLQCKINILTAKLEAVKDLHDKYDGPHTYCRECGGLTPCDTMNAADGKEG